MTALNISNFIWGIADDMLRDVYVRGKYRDVILPMTVNQGRFEPALRKAFPDKYDAQVIRVGSLGIHDSGVPLGLTSLRQQ